MESTLSDDVLRKSRKKLHQHFVLPMNRPYFRRANRYLYKEEQISKFLVNPHIGIKSQGNALLFYVLVNILI